MEVRMGLIKLMKENAVSQDLCLYTLTVLVWNFGWIVVYLSLSTVRSRWNQLINAVCDDGDDVLTLCWWLWQGFDCTHVMFPSNCCRGDFSAILQINCASWTLFICHNFHFIRNSREHCAGKCYPFSIMRRGLVVGAAKDFPDFCMESVICSYHLVVEVGHWEPPSWILHIHVFLWYIKRLKMKSMSVCFHSFLWCNQLVTVTSGDSSNVQIGTV